MYKYLYLLGLCLSVGRGKCGRGEVGTLKKIESSEMLGVCTPQSIGTWEEPMKKHWLGCVTTVGALGCGV